MRIVVALGGNALLPRGTPMTFENQQANISAACRALAPLASAHELVITHGNGPQVGLLALQATAYDEESAYPFDVLDAETEGGIGYLIEREMRNHLPPAKPVATVVTMIEVDPADPALADPTKFVGPVYSSGAASRLAAAHGWVMKPDGDGHRRVVASPLPLRVLELLPITWLLEKGAVVICAGGGGVPIMFHRGSGSLVGVEAVVDKDHASAVLARDLRADLLVIATDVDAVYLNRGTAEQRAIARAHPDAIRKDWFPAGSMGPKVEAAVSFVSDTGHDAVIGALDELDRLLAGVAGTRITTTARGIQLHPTAEPTQGGTMRGPGTA
jgi:carbamate kinase